MGSDEGAIYLDTSTMSEDEIIEFEPIMLLVKIYSFWESWGIKLRAEDDVIVEANLAITENIWRTFFWKTYDELLVKIQVRVSRAVKLLHYVSNPENSVRPASYRIAIYAET